MATHRIVTAAAALPFFKGKNIAVQTAKPIRVKGEDGKVRESFKTDMAPLAAAHVLAAKAYSDGRVTIVTIDGRRHEAEGTIPEEAPAAAGADGKGAK